ncbi:MAG: hypothetical protein AAF628_02765 [Planctomycetota bacterium]
MLQPRHRSARRVAAAVFPLVALGASATAQSIYNYTGAAGGDLLGWAVSDVGDVNKDGTDDFAIAAPYHDAGGTDAGAVYVHSGADGSVLFTFNGTAALDHLGYSLSAAGDVNNDTFPDIIAGAPGPAVAAVGPGKAVVFSGQDGSVLLTINGEVTGDRFGHSVSDAFDVNLDGFGDLLVGAPGDDEVPFAVGRAYLISGADGSTLRTFLGNTERDRFGHAVEGIGDLNGDGRPEAIVGAPLDNVGASDNGSVTVYSGIDGTQLSSFSLPFVNADMGHAISRLEDLNGDSIPEYVVSARWQQDNGVTHVFNGATQTRLFIRLGNSVAVWSGFSIANVGDINRDSVPDLAVSAPLEVGTPVYPDVPMLGGVRFLSGVDGSPIRALIGPEDQTWYGHSIAAVDVDSDGVRDLVVGEPLGQNGRGRVEVVPSFTTFVGSREKISTRNGGTQNMILRAGPSFGNMTYFVLGSAVGTRPVVPIPPIELPLVPDGYFAFTFSQPGTPPLGNTFGTLDAQGRAVATFSIPGGLTNLLIGITLHHAYVVFDGSLNPVFASNAVPLVLWF